MASHPAALHAALTAELPWAVAEELGDGVVGAPALSEGRVRWLRFTVEEALRQPAGQRFASSDEVRDALHMFESALESAAGALEFLLRPGDLLVVDNTRCLHARTAVPDPRESDRLLLRTKVRADWDYPETAPQAR